MSQKKAFTLTEMLISSVVIVIFFTSTLGVYVVAKNLFANIISDQGFQRDVNWVMNRMISGVKHSGTKFGIRSARSFSIPSITEINFVGTDGFTRKFYLGGGGIVYEDPTGAPVVQTLYRLPPGATIALQFWEPASHLDHEELCIYLAVTKTVSGRTVSGSLSTNINIRNLPK